MILRIWREVGSQCLAISFVLASWGCVSSRPSKTDDVKLSAAPSLVHKGNQISVVRAPVCTNYRVLYDGSESGWIRPAAPVNKRDEWSTEFYKKALGQTVTIGEDCKGRDTLDWVISYATGSFTGKGRSQTAYHVATRSPCSYEPFAPDVKLVNSQVLVWDNQKQRMDSSWVLPKNHFMDAVVDLDNDGQDELGVHIPSRNEAVVDGKLGFARFRGNELLSVFSSQFNINYDCPNSEIHELRLSACAVDNRVDIKEELLVASCPPQDEEVVVSEKNWEVRDTAMHVVITQ